MTGNDVPDDDMLSIPQPQRQGGSAVTDADLTALLAGDGAAPGLRPLADMLAALTAEPTAGELAGQARALAEYRSRAVVPEPRQHARRGPAVLAPLLSAKATAAAAGIAVVLGGVATAAYADVLPAPIQRLAHEAFGAPNAPAPRPAAPTRRLVAPVSPAESGSPAAQGHPGTGRAPQAKGKHGSAQGQGQGSGQAQGSGQGQQGSGQSQQGSGSGQGQQGSGSGQGQHGQGRHGSGPGQGNPHAVGRHRNPDKPGRYGNPHANPWPAYHRHARHARQANARMAGHPSWPDFLWWVMSL